MWAAFCFLVVVGGSSKFTNWASPFFCVGDQDCKIWVSFFASVGHGSMIQNFLFVLGDPDFAMFVRLRLVVIFLLVDLDSKILFLFFVGVGGKGGPDVKICMFLLWCWVSGLHDLGHCFFVLGIKFSRFVFIFVWRWVGGLYFKIWVSMLCLGEWLPASFVICLLLCVVLFCFACVCVCFFLRVERFEDVGSSCHLCLFVVGINVSSFVSFGLCWGSWF
jgi:hypothetical protein